VLIVHPYTDTTHAESSVYVYIKYELLRSDKGFSELSKQFASQKRVQMSVSISTLVLKTDKTILECTA